MPEIPVISTKDSTALTFVNADAGGDFFKNDGSTVLFIVGPTGAFTVTILNARDSNFGDHPDYPVVIPNGQTQALTSRFSPYRFSNGAGITEVEYSDATGVSIAAMSSHLLLRDPEV